MKKPILLVMAAGMGSRYGGLKQMDPVGSNGELIIDFSLYDAYRAGFETAVCVIKHEIEDDFKAVMQRGAAKKMNILYAYQDLDDIPEGFEVPKERVKPWGTGHAILAARKICDAPFAVINADDYYGPEAFKLMYEQLSKAQDGEYYDYCMVGYKIGNTLSENGSVSRGVCSLDKDGCLTDITERTRIQRNAGKIQFSEDHGESWQDLDEDSTVSMNLFGFTPGIMKELEEGFKEELPRILKDDPLKGEFFIPKLTSDLIKCGKAKLKLLRSSDKWYGVTYKEDKAGVVAALKDKKDKGIYPEKLWD